MSGACACVPCTHTRACVRVQPAVLIMVGVNGGGKTTTVGKLAAKFRDEVPESERGREREGGGERG